MRRGLRRAGTAALLVAVVGVVPVSTQAGTVRVAPGAPPEELPLGPAGLSETRAVTRLAPGITRTVIRRGHRSSREHFTVDVDVVATRAAARRLARRLRVRGYEARAFGIGGRAPDDPRSGPPGFVVRVGSFAGRGRADSVAEALVADGYDGAVTTYSGEDGGPTTGPWVVNVLEFDPARARDRVEPALGSGVVPGLEPLSSISRRLGTVAGVNGGFFVIEPADGAPGDLAGISVIEGELVSEAVDGRAALVIDGDRPRVARVATRLQAGAAAGAARLVDGLNRLPGLVRACGGDGGDEPTERPKHDFTCTDPSELVLFTRRFGERTPSGSGAEAALDRRGEVLRLRPRRGGPIPRRGAVLSATGTAVGWLRGHARLGEVVDVRTRVRGMGSPMRDGPGVVNGGPLLVRDGAVAIDAFAEGFVWRDDPAFYYYFGARRNPRTMAGVTAAGHLLLVTVDGRRPGWSVGASFEEEAAILRALGSEDALNLDGGGSTTMTVGAHVVNRPGDETGERPVGDALVLVRAGRE